MTPSTMTKKRNPMKHHAPDSAIAEDGLRYKDKKAGTIFPTSAAGIGNTMSCFKCGNHRGVADLETKRLLGRNERVCKGGCAKKK